VAVAVAVGKNQMAAAVAVLVVIGLMSLVNRLVAVARPKLRYQY
jgi:hypothetical protein